MQYPKHAQSAVQSIGLKTGEISTLM